MCPGKSADAKDTLRMRSRAQREGILKGCDVAVNIGDRACKAGEYGVIIRPIWIRGLLTSMCHVLMRNRGPGPPDGELIGGNCGERNTGCVRKIAGRPEIRRIWAAISHGTRRGTRRAALLLHVTGASKFGWPCRSRRVNCRNLARNASLSNSS